MNIKELYQEFRDPGPEYRPAPFWFWNDELRDDEIEWQLDQFREQGIYVLIPLPLSGLPHPFASEEYWERFAFAARAAAKRKMKMWIYDECVCPSGSAAGFLLRYYPWTRVTDLRYHAVHCPPGQTMEFEYDGDPLFANVVQPDGQATEVLSALELSGEKEKKARWRNDTGDEATLILFCRSLPPLRSPPGGGHLWLIRQEGLGDLMNRETVATYLDYVHGRAAQQLGDLMGKVVDGAFTDEPIPIGSAANGLHYTPGLFEKFNERYGYDLRQRAHELVLDVGDFAQTRYHYRSLVADLFGERFHAQYRRYCEKHGMTYTGHLLYEERLKDSLLYAADPFRSLRQMHAPGIDMLACADSFQGLKCQKVDYGRDSRSYLVTGKAAESTAKFAGAKRVLCEAFGIMPWTLTMGEMKVNHDWLFSVGVNWINDNGIPYSTRGFRKETGGKFFLTPWWRFYKTYSDYCGRLCALGANTRNVAEIGVLYPSASAWCLFNQEVSEKSDDLPADHPWSQMQEAVFAALDVLYSNHLGFDIIFEDTLADASVEDGILRVGEAQYRAVVIPASPYLPRPSAEKLQAFVQSGGTVIALGSRPHQTPEGDDLTIAFGEIPLLALDDGLEEELVAVMDQTIDRRIRLTGEGGRQLIVAERRGADERFFFIANHCDGPVEATVSILGTEPVESWDMATGERFAFKMESDQERQQTDYQFAPQESLLLAVPADPSRSLPAQEPPPSQVQALADTWQFSTDGPNCLLLNPEVRLDPDRLGTEQAWFKGNDGGQWHPVEDGWSTVDIYPEISRYFWLRTQVNIEHRPDDLALVLDSEDVRNVFVNGEPVEQNGTTTLWTRDNVVYPMVKHLKEGENTIIIRFERSPLYARIIMDGTYSDPRRLPIVVLTGDFSVDDSGRIAMVKAPRSEISTGSWHDQGYPNFVGTGICEQTLRLERKPGRAVLEVSKARDVIEALVNGRSAGVRAWSPYRFEIGDLLEPGENRIALHITNTLGNLLKGYWRAIWNDPVEAGLLGEVLLYLGEE